MSKKILVLEPYLDQLGGSEKMTYEVAKGLAEKGWEIHLGFVKTGIWRKRYSSFVKNFHKIPSPAVTIRKPWQVIITAFGLNKKLKKEKLNIVFTSCIAYILSLAFLKIFFGIKSCLHLGLSGAVINTIGWRWAMRKISAGIAPSEHIAKSWQRVGWPDQRLHIVPNWIDWGEFRELPSKEEARKCLGVDGGRREGAGGRELNVVAYVGRLVEEKGIEVFLEAWNQAFAKDEDTVLLIAGTGKPEYEAKLKAKAAKNVKFLGGLEDTKPVYRASDLTVVPSIWEEPFGLVPLETIACGTIPLVSDKGFLPEIVKKEKLNLVYSAKDKKELIYKMKKLLSTKNSPALKRVKKYCRKNFSEEKELKKYEKVLKHL